MSFEQVLWLYKAIAELEAARIDQGSMDGSQLEIAAHDASLVATRMEELGQTAEAGLLNALSNRLSISSAAALAAEKQKVEEAERLVEENRERQLAYGLRPEDPVHDKDEDDEEEDLLPKRSQLSVLLKEPHRLAPAVQAKVSVAEEGIEQVHGLS